MNDIFEKIIKREVPASIVFEDERVLAFLDIKPINKGHVLVIPKQHFENIFDADEELLAHMMQVTKKIAIAVQKAVGADGINIGMNNGAAAGQEVMHAHMHIIPRFVDDGRFLPHPHDSYGEGEMEIIRHKIENAIA